MLTYSTAIFHIQIQIQTQVLANNKSLLGLRALFYLLGDQQLFQ